MRIIAWLLFATATLFAWDSKIHSGIIQASLMPIPPEDRILQRWGDEAWRLREYVQMADWINDLVSLRERWQTGGQVLEQSGFQFFANDFLLFPSAPHSFPHMVPDVKATYRPFFLRALQALRTESPANAARWTGSLLHFVTDSGSPPHTIGVTGPAHIKMESWLDTSGIDLGRYRPRLLGDTDEAAAKGLAMRMEDLIAFSAIRGKAMLPFAEVDDRAHMEPKAIESAAETARVAADVIHTLLRLTSHDRVAGGANLLATVSSPEIGGLENLPAKLVILGTDYSTLSDQSLPAFRIYRGSFSLRGIPPGTYRLAIERVGSQTLFTPPVTLKAGETIRHHWSLRPAHAEGNLAPNPDFALHWLRPDAPDHWRFDAPRRQWLSDNIPLAAGRHYRVGCQFRVPSAEVELQWMAHAWEALKTPPVPMAHSPLSLVAPPEALFARFIVKSQQEPSSVLKEVSIQAADANAR